MIFETKLLTPIGEMLMQSDEDALLGVYFPGETSATPFLPAKLLPDAQLPACLRLAKEELKGYFAGEIKEFSVPLAYHGTDFQLLAWDALRKIPYGEVRTYQQQATMIGKPSALRAVGGANHANRISILIPCHRVIGKNGKLVGFGGGLWRKEWLLQHEMKYR